MRSTALGLVLGCVVLASGSCGGGDPAGACDGPSDCGDGQRCDRQLGCVPEVGADADADTDADSDADADADGDADDPSGCATLAGRCESGDQDACAAYETLCRAPLECWALWEDCGQGDEQACLVAHERDCGLPEDCETLEALCDMGDAEACAARESADCDPNVCGADGSCNQDCADLDPDCVQDGECPQSCGALPDTALDWCEWGCGDNSECVLQPREPGAVEVCRVVDPGMDEDCDGRVDCEDADCVDAEGCR